MCQGQSPCRFAGKKKALDESRPEGKFFVLIDAVCQLSLQYALVAFEGCFGITT